MVAVMRIMPDTNVMVSAALYPDSKVSRALSEAMQKHSLVICTHVIEELQDVFKRKFPQRIGSLDTFLSRMSYELCYTPRINENTPAMRDENDRPILQAAIDAEVEAILTGDADFHALNIDSLKIISPAELLDWV